MTLKTKFRQPRLLAAILVAAGMLCCLPQTSAVEWIVNGDFEDASGTFPTGWTSLVAGNMPTATQGLVGTNTGLWMEAGESYIEQQIGDNVGRNWELNLYFATEDPGTADDRSFQLTVGPVNLRVNGEGAIQAYNDGWIDLITEGVTFSENNSGLTGFTGTGDVLNLHRLQVVGDFTLNPTYTVYLSEAGSDVLSMNSGIVTLNPSYSALYPIAGPSVVRLRSSISQGSYVVDEMSLIADPKSLLPNVKHLGSTDPVEEGWERILSGDNPSAITFAQGNTETESWRVSDGSTVTRGCYTGTFEEALANQALANGFRLDVEAFVPNPNQTTDGGATVSMVLGGENPAFDIYLGSDTDGNALVKFGLTGTTYDIGTGGFHKYSILYDPETELASLYADDVLLGTDAGRSFITDTSFVRFGSVTTPGTGSAYYSLVELTVEETPDQIPGDANNDKKVDGSDVTILAGNWQVGVDGTTEATWEMGDFNGDKKVDGSDVTILAGNWQYGVTAATAAVPEPSAVVLLFGAIGTLLIWKRRP